MGCLSIAAFMPLTYQSSNSEDILPLTPNHFLLGQLGGDFSPEVDQKIRPVERWKFVQQLISHFWKRWIAEWLPKLNPRSKWRKTQRDVGVGDIVLALSQKNDRGKWPLGRVLETSVGEDGHVRRVKVLINGKVFDRGLNSLSLIVPNNEFFN